MDTEATRGLSAIAQGEAPSASCERIQIKVVHGHLAFAKYPVLVGHYNGDTFAGAEAQLDGVLDGRLSQRRHLGLYPGPLETSAVVLDSLQRPPGAVVVGLGETANLSLGGLRRTIRQGVLALAADEADLRRAMPDSTACKVKVSALLVGSGEGGLDLTTCVTALLQAMAEAQSALATRPGMAARLTSIEILEVLEARAHAVWRILDRAVATQANLGKLFACDREIERRGGARRWSAAARDRSWWEPIQITMMKAGTNGEEGQRGLSFAVSGGRARAELRTIAADLDVVGPLMQRAIKAEGPEGATVSPGRALFELLWPATLKDQSLEERNRRLVLDEDSAQFPWELLDDRRPWAMDSVLGDVARDPPAVRYGMVRQLLQSRFQERVVVPTGRPKALIICDPPEAHAMGFLPLPGALDEAIAVRKILETSHDVVVLSERDATPENICQHLVAEAWEIVHIAAHGVVRKKMAGSDGVLRPMTGVVLGSGIVLGPSVLSKMPVAPNLFFLNCCHIGKVEPGAEESARKAALAVNQPELAASVAVQLIRSGVRAVVAAGWAVDDDAALEFSKKFYGIMLDGGGFGEATLFARGAAYQVRPSGTTWGAYQCYGEPDYALPRAYRQVSQDGSADRKGHHEPFVACAEAIAAVEQIRDDVNIGLERDIERQRARLDTIEIEAKTRNWLGVAELRVAFGEAQAELGELRKAIDHYEAARAGGDSRFNVKAIEQLANLRARSTAVGFHYAGQSDGLLEVAVEEIKAAGKLIDDLIRVLGPTPERLAIAGGCWKRLAQVQAKSDAADEALARMAGCYEEAVGYLTEGQAGGLRPIHRSYPMLMHLSARLTTALRIGKSTKALHDELLKLAREIGSPEPDDFWLLIAATDLRMMTAMASGTLSEKEEAGIRQSYLDAWKHVGSPVKLLSVIEQLDFYEDMLSFGSGETESFRQSLVAPIRRMSKALTGFRV